MTPSERGRLDAVLQRRGVRYVDWLVDHVEADYAEITGGSEMNYTYKDHFQAHYGKGVVTIPDQVAENQRGWVDDGNKPFTAIMSGNTKVRVRLAPEKYGLLTGGTGDPVVTSA